MKVTCVLIGTLVVLHLVHGQGCGCSCCNPAGLFCTDEPNSRPRTLVVRPKPLVRPVITLPWFQPNGKSPCYRQQAIVKPAVVPMPEYPKCQCDPSQIVNGNVMDIAAAAESIVNSLQAVDLSKAYKTAYSPTTHSPPADIISMTIAFNQNNQKCYDYPINEDRLSYGFRKLPIDCPNTTPQVIKQVLPESNLYAINGDVVEFKPIKEAAPHESLSAEAEDELIDLAISEEAKHQSGHVIRGPSLNDIGFTPVKDTKKFLEMPTLPKPEVLVTATDAPCANDGFKPGTVELKNVPAHDNSLTKLEELVSDVEKLLDGVEEDEKVFEVSTEGPSCHRRKKCHRKAKL